MCQVIAARGYENTRFSDVAARAGASIGSLQYLFGSREDMVVTALEARTQTYLAEVAHRAAEIEDPLHRLAWVATCLATGVGDEESSLEEWLVWTEYWRAALRDDDLRESSTEAYGRWIVLVEDAVTACAEADLFPSPDGLRSIAAGAVALGDGLGIQISLRHPGMTWESAGSTLREWLAARLGLPRPLQVPPR